MKKATGCKKHEGRELTRECEVCSCSLELDNAVFIFIKNWANSHPYPDQALIITGYRTYSPKQILEEIKNGTDFGNLQKQALKEILIKAVDDAISGKL
jgi:hypothetical protein